MADASTDSTIRYPELPPTLQGGFHWRMLTFFGAGAIMASVTIGSGETVFASQAGAVFGYGLLWCFIGSAIMKGLQVYAAARYMTLTGEHPMTHWAHMPGPKNWAPMLMAALSLVSFPFWLAGLPMLLGQTINWITGIDASVLGMTQVQADAALAQLGDAAANDPQGAAILAGKSTLFLYNTLWATLAIGLAVTLTYIQTYDILEKTQVAIVGILLASLLIACLASQPDWLAVLAGFVPAVPVYPEWVTQSEPIMKTLGKAEWAYVAVCLGAIGGGTYDYLGYIGCFREKKWGAIGLGHDAITDDDVRQNQALPIDDSDENLRRGRTWLWPAKIDVGVGFLSVLIFTACFIILGAVVLHPQQDVPTGFDLLSRQSQFLTQFHPALLYVYQLGIFMAIWGTIYGAYEVYIRTAYECLMPLSAKLRAMPMVTFRRWVLFYCAIGALTVLWGAWWLGETNPTKVVAPAAIIGGVFACGLWCLAMIWADRRFLPKKFQAGPLLTVGLWVSGIALTALGVYSIWADLINPWAKYILKITASD